MCFKRSLIAGLLSGALMLGLASVSFASAEALKPEVAFKEAFPSIPVDSFTPSEIPGLYEVASGPNILYYYPAKDLFIVGDLVGKDLKSRTAERRNALMKEKNSHAVELAKTLPLDKAVKIGDGKKVVIEFTDPDCPYCRKAFEYFSKRTDVTQYVFFAALAHPAAINKIYYILGADNKAQAFDAMMLGQEIPASAKPVTPAVQALAQQHLDLAKKLGIQGTPTFFIKGEQVIGADTSKMDSLLK
jgi:thiol:disulfide interchange protein DsbC